MKTTIALLGFSLLVSIVPLVGADANRPYTNQLTPIKKPKPLLADHPEWVEPIRETNRWEAPAIVNDADADLHVRACGVGGINNTRRAQKENARITCARAKRLS